METTKKSMSEMSFLYMLTFMYTHKRLYFITCGIAFVLGLVVSFSIPKTYKTKVMLSPETTTDSKLGSLSSLTSLVGANLNMNEDAIGPQYYPNVLKSRKFIMSLFDIKVTSLNGDIKTTLYDYCKNHQNKPWWSMLNPMGLFRVFSKEQAAQSTNLPSNYLTKEQSKIADAIEDMLTCSIDPKDGFITISATAQDPLISTELVDSVSNRLQQFIIEYRTSKARHDAEYLQRLYTQAEREYNEAREEYSRFSDSHSNIVLKSYGTKEEDLENRMQLKFNMFTHLAQQLNVAQGKILESTPVFAEIEPAIVPIKKSGPKTMLITLGYILLAFMGTSAWLYGKQHMSLKRNA